MADEPRLYRPRPREVPASERSTLTDSLNAEQARAATFGDAPLLVIAGAGTGKTRTLIHRVAHLIERGVAAERILLLTFTRRAAGEMLSRAERLVGSAGARVQRFTPSAIACCDNSARRPGYPPASPSWTRATPRT
jgi:DNA helicase II / ATP-dependent DNA helicase PcrA